MDSFLSLILPDGLPLLPFTKAIGITTSAILAGTAVSSTLLPRTLLATSQAPEPLSASIHSLSKHHHHHDPPAKPHADNQTIAIQWRRSQRVGLFSTIPICTLASSCWAFLGLSTPSDAIALRVLYTTSAIILPISVSVAIFAQQRVSAELLSLASGDELESQSEVQAETLLKRWARIEAVKAVVLGLGAVAGTWASLNEAFLGGIQVGASYIIQQLVEQQNARGAAAAAGAAA